VPEPLPRLLAMAFKAARGDLQRRLEEHGVYAGQDYLLDALSEEDGLTVGALAERLRIEVPTVVKTVQRMEAAELVRRSPDPADRRRSLVHLTERGRAVMPAVREALAAVTERGTAGLSPEETEELLRMLAVVNENLRGGGRDCA
jgi:DNA-binding MarR family transcriptional regulator